MDKRLIIELLHQQLDEKISVLRVNLQNQIDARNNEDKCTVGDKYETGRAMTQMELEKTQVQLSKTEDLKNVLSKIDLKMRMQKVEFGSLVATSQGNYFFSIAFGKIKAEGESIFCLSPVSPIGQLLLGKRKGDKVILQGKETEILQIN